jgi:hypothetical protein
VSAHSVREGEIDPSQGTMVVRLVGFGLVIFAVAFNLPYALLASNFDYPAILRSPPGVILEAFAAGGAPLILAWAAFALAALLFAPIAVAVATVTRREGHASSAVAALGVAAGVTQAIGLSRWVYAVPGLAAGWVASAADPGLRSSIEASFTTLHQFAGVGVGEAIGQLLNHPHRDLAVAANHPLEGLGVDHQQPRVVLDGGRGAAGLVGDDRHLAEEFAGPQQRQHLLDVAHLLGDRHLPRLENEHLLARLALAEQHRALRQFFAESLKEGLFCAHGSRARNCLVS